MIVLKEKVSIKLELVDLNIAECEMVNDLVELFGLDFAQGRRPKKLKLKLEEIHKILGSEEPPMDGGSIVIFFESVRAHEEFMTALENRFLKRHVADLIQQGRNA